MTDPVEDLRQVVLELADGLQEVAKTLTLGGEVRDTAEAMIALGEGRGETPATLAATRRRPAA